MGRTIGSKNRTTEAILKARLDKLEADYKKDMRIMWRKLKDRQLCSRAQATEIGKIIKHLKGRNLWPVK